MRMTRRNVSITTWSALTLLAALAGCASDVAESDGDSVASSPAELQPGRRVIPFTPIADPVGIGSTGPAEVRRLITSGVQYQQLFGHAAPAGVNFGAGDAVLYYSAGVKLTGGYVASVSSVETGFGRLFVTTQLQSPGPDCPVTQSLTHPFALVKFRRPLLLLSVHFDRSDSVRQCPKAPSCDDQVCNKGKHCELLQVQCFTTPCFPVPHCVPDVPTGPFCGGIAGIQCPGFGQCQDNPNDSCDPDNGGADCGGTCTCIDTVLCIRGTIFDPSPEVCACVPDPREDPCASVRCRAGTHCEAPDGQAACVPDAPFCGGIANIQCPGAGECTDDPNDGCDPSAGGADCGGRCKCEALGKCTADSIWDDSPDVCACVPIANPCAFTECERGMRCEVRNGSAICLSDGTLACGKVQCPSGTTCCNPSCGGMCTPPGFACIQIACDVTP